MITLRGRYKASTPDYKTHLLLVPLLTHSSTPTLSATTTGVIFSFANEIQLPSHFRLGLLFFLFLFLRLFRRP